MKSSEVRRILKSKMPIEEKKRILDNAFEKPNTGKFVAGALVAAAVAGGLTKLVADKLKEKKLIKEIEEQEEAEFWDSYLESYDVDDEALTAEEEAQEEHLDEGEDQPLVCEEE